MTKVELIAAVANDANLTKQGCRGRCQQRGPERHHRCPEGRRQGHAGQGFGTFEVRERPERKGRNPQTGAEITIEFPSCPLSKLARL